MGLLSGVMDEINKRKEAEAANRPNTNSAFQQVAAEIQRRKAMEMGSNKPDVNEVLRRIAAHTRLMGGRQDMKALARDMKGMPPEKEEKQQAPAGRSLPKDMKTLIRQRMGMMPEGKEEMPTAMRSRPQTMEDLIKSRR